MAAAKDCQKVVCAPEVDCKLNPNFANSMDPEFREDESCLRCEALFKKTGKPLHIRVWNLKHKVLYFMKKEKKLLFEEMLDSDIEVNSQMTQLVLQRYGCEGGKILIALSVKDESNNYILSCKNNELQFKVGDFPDKVEDKDKDILLWKIPLPGSENIKFKSFLYSEYYLACEEKRITEILVLK
ncbi:interleukin-18-like [Sminthopsis crassicaudata]|uniref:interleukin-18-like n=1 Tax=Sminthopsis crassicaudata TaxID=9301 RepID=UPI003D69F7B6